jgi:D-alanyl-D-alanine carboxypeptidase
MAMTLLVAFAGAARAEAPLPEGGEPARLDWVDPARCLKACAAAPPGTMRRLDAAGAVSPRGQHRVEARTAEALAALIADARAAGFRLRINSAYRSYKDQARVFRATKERGRAARPGHSEHQLGTAVDLRLPSTAAIEWLQAHAFEYGFALSYPAGKQRVTGYRPEPWHVRFVGLSVAAELRQHGWTLAELFRARPELGDSGTCTDCPLAVSRAPCGRVTERGSCRGTVLTWCYDGALATVDCSVSDQICDGAQAPADCRSP